MRRILPAVVILGAVALVGRAQSPPRDTAAQQSGAGAVRGRVLAAGTGAPLRHARVQIASALGARPIVLTDADGRFVVTALAPGQYRVSASKAGHVTTSSSSITVSGGGIAENADLGLPKAAVISGQIRDSFGEPVVGMTVTAERPAAPDAFRTSVVATTQTDDLGNYRLGGLPEGSFFVAGAMREFVIPSRAIVVLNGSAALGSMTVGTVTGLAGGAELSPQRTYYPGASIVEQAQSIPLAAGEERTSIDIVVPALQMQSVPGVARSLNPDARMVVRDGAVVSIDATHGRPLGPDCRSESVCRAAIRGRVTRSDGTPLRQAFVWLLAEGAEDQPPMVLTDDAGRYEFARLPAGTFRVAASRPGYLTAEYGQPRAPGAGDPIELEQNAIRDRADIVLPRTGAITTRVVDDAGEPVADADVRLLRIGYEAGRRRLIVVSARRTDDEGRYRFYGLQPGQYAVRAAAGAPGFAATYFPGTANPAEAQLVALDLSQEVSGVDFPLSSVPTVRISGTVLDAMGRPLIGSVTLRSSRRSGSLDAVVLDADVGVDGTFEFPGVAPGEYAVQADSNPRRVLPAAGARFLRSSVDEFASAYVTVAGADVNGLVIRASAGSTAAGRLSLDEPVSEFFNNEVDIMAVSVDPDLSLGRRTSYVGIGPDLSVLIEGLSGPRVFRLTRAPRGWALRAVRLGGIDVTDTPIDFGTPGQSVRDLEIVLTRRASEVSGYVANARGRRVAGATIVVFAGDRQLWGPASRFVTMAKADRDGAFSIRGLPPADYFAVAVDSVTEGEWQAPEFLDSVFPDATRLTVLEGDKLAVSLRLVAR